MASNPPRYPEKLAIEPLARPPRATIRVPGSKSITNRALVLAALTRSRRPCEVRGALRSEDTEVMIDALRRLGFDVRTDWDDSLVTVAAPESAPLIPASRADLFVANSGTTMRFLTAMVALGSGRYRLDGVPRMHERPIADLLDALRQLGVDARSKAGTGCPPVVIESDGLPGGHVRIRGDVSSQFLSGLLMMAPLARGPVTIEVEGPLVSRPYVDMTVHMIAAHHPKGEAGLRIIDGPGEPLAFVTPGGEPCYGRGDEDAHLFPVEPDASAASYFFAAAALTGGTVRVPGRGRPSLQGDVRFVEVLAAMGCHVEEDAGGLTVRGGPLRGVDVDMNAISDTVMTLAAVALFTEGPTTIRNVAHIRHKETDRLAALAAELRRLGAGVEETADGLHITPRPLRPAEVETYDDHRMAMALALVGLRVPGVTVKDPGCVAKTYPHFFDDLEALRC
jgi:3-phosphoshikimate 1-carboxyvinyltransferase